MWRAGVRKGGRKEGRRGSGNVWGESRGGEDVPAVDHIIKVFFRADTRVAKWGRL